MSIIVLFLILIVLICSIDIGFAIHRSYERKKYYRMANQRALETGKKLLVIGDPDNGFVNKLFGRDYNCGDVCTDLIGCKKCGNSIEGKVEDILPTMNSNSYVIFISCTLEYIDSIDLVIDHLKRVSGEDLFIITINPYCPTSFFYTGRFFTGESGAKRRIFTEYPFKDIKYKTL